MNLSVIVFRRPNLFVVNDNMYNMLGVGELKNMYTIPDYKTTHKKLVLYYPERFLNILELRCLIERLENTGYEEVTILTGNEHLITTVPNGSLKIFSDELIPENKGHFKLSNDDVGLPNYGGLGVVLGGV